MVVIPLTSPGMNQRFLSCLTALRLVIKQADSRHFLYRPVKSAGIVDSRRIPSAERKVLSPQIFSCYRSFFFSIVKRWVMGGGGGADFALTPYKVLPVLEGKIFFNGCCYYEPPTPV